MREPFPVRQSEGIEIRLCRRFARCQAVLNVDRLENRFQVRQVELPFVLRHSIRYAPDVRGQDGAGCDNLTAVPFNARQEQIQVALLPGQGIGSAIRRKLRGACRRMALIGLVIAECGLEEIVRISSGYGVL